MNMGDTANEEQIEQTKQYLADGCKTTGYKNCDVKVDGTKIIYSYDNDPEDASFDATGNMEAVKKALEENGHSCKE
jgi:hypothetical protein